MHEEQTPQRTIVELCRQFYGMGWVTGTGGGISIREGGRIYMAPSGVQKERLRESDIYVLGEDEAVISGPSGVGVKPSECGPLFFNAFRLRGAGAVIHSHSVYALLATLLSKDVFECTEIEMIKGIAGNGYFDRLIVPIIENTARECDLRDRMAVAMEAHPTCSAVLVRRHGVYIWGRTWAEAKTQAECYHYLFETAVRMAQLGLDIKVGARETSHVAGAAEQSEAINVGRVTKIGGGIK